MRAGTWLHSSARRLGRRTSLWQALIALPLVSLSACAPNRTPVLEDGSAEIGVGALALSADTDIARVAIHVTGPNMNPMDQQLLKSEGQWRGLIGGIPAGPNRVFTATAYDVNNVKLFEGSTAGVSVQGGNPILVMIVLQEFAPPGAFSNAAPKILAVTASDPQTAPGQVISLHVDATDADNDPLNYAWNATDGTLNSASTTDPTWTAPNAGQFDTLSVHVDDGRGAESAFSFQVLTVLEKATSNLATQFNVWPVVQGITADGQVAAGGTVDVALTAGDADGDAITIEWSDDCGGSFSSLSSNTPTWTAPAVQPVSGACTLTATVTDTRGGHTTGSVVVQIGLPQTVNIPPVIDQEFQSALSARPNHTAQFGINAHDPEGKALTFSWSGSSGSLGTPTTNSAHSEVVWTAPQTTGPQTVTVVITDADGGESTHSFNIDVNCSENADCGLTTDCATRACNAGACSTTYTADGTPTQDQTPQDCQEVQCDGAGATKSIAAEDCATGFACSGMPGMCTNIDDCASNPCQNGGTCADGINSYTCSCAAGYAGTNCEMDVNDCASNPCQNGGTCADGVNTYTCSCPAGYSGTNCETDINDCASNPCQNGGTCTDGVNTYTCSCPAGYTGTNCETNIDDCASNPCQNGGTCTDGANTYTCSCPAGYSGTNCESDVNECATNNGGCDGNATCTNTPGSRTCACNAGYTGDGFTCVGATAACAGVASNCGPNQNESCCAAPLVTGGTYNRRNDPNYPATVSNFRLDRFEVTVGRFRKFVEAYPGSKPGSGAGAHPLIPGSGWNSAWNANLPVDQAALQTVLSGGTWTATAGANERLPISRTSWYVTFAFCAWDGGRIPTDAEWGYASSGGNEQRLYAWGSATPVGTYANTSGGSMGAAMNVGSKPLGDGKWGHADLIGNVREWTLDSASNLTTTCVDCAQVTPGFNKYFRGGDHFVLFTSTDYETWNPTTVMSSAGIRCARKP